MITFFSTLGEGHITLCTTTRCGCRFVKNASSGLSEDIIITIAH